MNLIERINKANNSNPMMDLAKDLTSEGIGEENVEDKIKIEEESGLGRLEYTALFKIKGYLREVKKKLGVK